jgi:hypothetical protein
MMGVVAHVFATTAQRRSPHQETWADCLTRTFAPTGRGRRGRSPRRYRDESIPMKRRARSSPAGSFRRCGRRCDRDRGLARRGDCPNHPPRTGADWAAVRPFPTGRQALALTDCIHTATVPRACLSTIAKVRGLAPPHRRSESESAHFHAVGSGQPRKLRRLQADRRTRVRNADQLRPGIQALFRPRRSSRLSPAPRR